MPSKLISLLRYLPIFLLWPVLFGCKKLLQIPPPTSTITTQEVFADSADATAALLGVYSSIASSGSSISFGTGAISILVGSSSDELIPFNQSNLAYFYTNQLTSSIGGVDQYFWTPPYQILYNANACIEGTRGSSGLSPALQTQIVGECMFLRAFVNFYLVNLFGNVPLITTPSYKVNALLPRTSTEAVYDSIKQDLYFAQKYLQADFTFSSNQRIRANQWAATALLARVFLYQGLYDSAEYESTQLINNVSLFTLATTPDSVFLANSSEAILQWNINPNVFPFNATSEGYKMIPASGEFPFFYLTPQLLSDFEPNDLRRALWVDSTIYNGVTYYYPYKYKIGPNRSANAAPTELYTALRLAEQYLIRSEARLKEGTNIQGAIDDLNIIRVRANLPIISLNISSSQLLTEIIHERRIELFAEWGHRWFDLKRTGAIDSVMQAVVPTKIGGNSWNSDQQLFPIPESELTANPNLTQNPGY